MTIRVVLVDDQQLVRAGFAMLVDSQPDLAVVGQAADGLEAIDVLARTPADVVLMDVRMPRLDGVEATRRITAGVESPRVIVLTTFDLDEYAFAALQAGASGFLLKDALPGDLLAAIRTVYAGDAVVAPSTTRRLISRYVQRAAPAVALDRPRRSRSVSVRCGWTSRVVSPIVRSRLTWGSRRPPSRPTWATSWPRRACAIGSRSWSWPTNVGHSPPTDRRDTHPAG